MELNDEQRRWLTGALEFIEWLTLHPEWIPKAHGLSADLWPTDSQVVDALGRLRDDAGPLGLRGATNIYPRFEAHISGPHSVRVWAHSSAITGIPSAPRLLPEVAELLAVDEAAAS